MTLHTETHEIGINGFPVDADMTFDLTYDVTNECWTAELVGLQLDGLTLTRSQVITMWSKFSVECSEEEAARRYASASSRDGADRRHDEWAAE